jgi:surface protein
MFANSNFNGDISKWDVSNAENMKGMFRGTKAFNQDISKWDVGSVTNMQDMFLDAKAFNQDISKWNVSRVTNMKSMFHRSQKFNQDISGWDVKNVTNFDKMFQDAKAFNHSMCKWKPFLTHMIGVGTRPATGTGPTAPGWEGSIENMFRGSKSYSWQGDFTFRYAKVSAGKSFFGAGLWKTVNQRLFCGAIVGRPTKRIPPPPTPRRRTPGGGTGRTEIKWTGCTRGECENLSRGEHPSIPWIKLDDTYCWSNGTYDEKCARTIPQKDLDDVAMRKFEKEGAYIVPDQVSRPGDKDWIG